MDPEMVAMFPNGIRAMMIDDDTKFLKAATMLLSVLNFDVVRCSSVAHALKTLSSGEVTGFDVILAHAANAAYCGFDFRAIVEADLLIPVIYFLEEDHEATGEEADELLRMLQAVGSYVIKKPLDLDEVRTRLWTVIAFRTCELENKARRGGEAGLLGVGGEADEDRVHFKVVTKGRGRKRKKGSSGSRSTGGGSSSSGSRSTGGHPSANKGKGKEIVGSSQQQQNEGRAKKALNNNGGCEAYNNLPQPNTTMMNGQQQHVQHQPNPSVHDLFMQSVRRMLAVPPTPNNPKLFTNATAPSYNPKFFFPGDAGPSSSAAAFGHTTGGAPAAAPAHPLYSAPPPALHPVARQQQQPSARNFFFCNDIAPSAAAPTMANAASPATAAYELQFSQGISNKQQQDVHPLLMFGPFPYQGPTPPPPVAVEQDILAPTAIGDPFIGAMAGGGMTGGASAAAATEAVTYGDKVNLSVLQAPSHGIMDMSASMDDTPMATTRHAVSNALDEEAMIELLLSDGFNNYTGSSNVVVPEDHQVLGTVVSNNLNELPTMAGGASGSNNNAVSLMAHHHDLSAAPNGGSSNTTTFMAPQDPRSARDGDNGDHQQQDVVPPQLMFGPFPYQGLPKPVVQQALVAPAAASHLLAGGMTAGVDTAGGASSAAAATTAASYACMADPHIMLPQHMSDDASGKAKMLDLLFNDDFNDYNAGSSLVAPDDQAPGMASNLNELTPLAGGAFGSSNNTAFMASQGQGTGAAMEGDDAAGALKEAMLHFDQYEDGDTSFPLEALLGDLHGPVFEFDDDVELDVLPVGSTGGGAASADDGAGTSLIAGEEGGGVNGLSNLAGLDIPRDIWQLNDLPSPQAKNKNNVRE